MKSTEFIIELYDPKNSFKLEWDDYFGPKEMHARAYDRQGNYIDIKFTPVRESMVDIEFSRNDSFDITGGGDASRVFGTILEAIRTYLKGYRPKYIIFSGKGESRYKLYQRLIDRYAHTFGYEQFDVNRFKPALRQKILATGTNMLLLVDMYQ